MTQGHTGLASTEAQLAEVLRMRELLKDRSSLSESVVARLGGEQAQWAPYREFDSRSDAYAELSFVVSHSWDNLKRDFGFGPPGPVSETLESLQQGRKHHKRLLVQVESAIDPTDRQRLFSMDDGYLQIAVHHPVETGMTIIDRRVLAQGDPKKLGFEGACVLTRDPIVVESHVALFEDIWSRSIPFVEAISRAEGIPSTTHMQVLRKVASGTPREIAAAELNVSARTHTRYVKEMCANYDVTTKVELVAKVRALGLLP